MTGEPGARALTWDPPGDTNVHTPKADVRQVIKTWKYFSTGWDTAVA